MGLYMKPWHKDFRLSTLPSSAPVWVRLPSLHVEYSTNEVFEGIGNALGEFMGASDLTMEYKQLSLARICVNLNLDAPLLEKINLQTDDHIWEQPLDYEHLPFRCRICHEYDHLAHNYPHTRTPDSILTPPLEPQLSPNNNNLNPLVHTPLALEVSNQFQYLHPDETGYPSPTELSSKTLTQTIGLTIPPHPVAPPSTKILHQIVGVEPLSQDGCSTHPTQSLEMDKQMIDPIKEDFPPLSSHGNRGGGSRSSTPSIKQTPSSLKIANTGMPKKRGRKSTQQLLHQTTQEGIDEGSQALIADLLAIKKPK